MKDLFNINPKISTGLCVVIAYILMDGLTSGEQNSLGNLLMLIAQTLITNASSQSLIERRTSPPGVNINSKRFKSQYNPPIYDIEYLKKLINDLDNKNFNDDINVFNSKLNDIQNFLNHLHN